MERQPVRPEVHQAVQEALRKEPAFAALPPDAQASIAQSLGSLAVQLAPAVPPPPTQPGSQPATPPPAQSDSGQTSSSGGGSSSSSPTGRVGEVARATLN